MATKSGVDLRLYARFELGTEAKVSSDGEAESVASRLVDIGLGGVSLETNTALEANSKVNLQIDIKSISLEVPCQVLYCCPNKQGSFSSGLKFVPSTHQERVAIAEFVHDVFQRQWEILAS